MLMTSWSSPVRGMKVIMVSPLGDHSTFLENPETFDDTTHLNNADNRGVDYGGGVSSPFVDEGRHRY